MTLDADKYYLDLETSDIYYYELQSSSEPVESVQLEAHCGSSYVTFYLNHEFSASYFKSQDVSNLYTKLCVPNA